MSVSTFGRSRGFRERSCGNDIVSSESECERSEQRAHTKPQCVVVAPGCRDRTAEKTETMITIKLVGRITTTQSTEAKYFIIIVWQIIDEKRYNFLITELRR